MTTWYFLGGDLDNPDNYNNSGGSNGIPSADDTVIFEPGESATAGTLTVAVAVAPMLTGASLTADTVSSGGYVSAGTLSANEIDGGVTAKDGTVSATTISGGPMSLQARSARTRLMVQWQRTLVAPSLQRRSARASAIPLSGSLS